MPGTTLLGACDAIDAVNTTLPAIPSLINILAAARAV